MDTKLKEKINKLIEIEDENSNSLRKALSTIKNLLVRELLGSIAYDSEKHAYMYKSILAYLEGQTTALNEQEFQELKDVIDKHIKIETEMIKSIEELLEKEKIDVKIGFILRYILQDEYRHHRLLKGLIEAIVKKEVITEEDWWNMTWKDALFHGTPGG
ncbi:MAG: hypothetical protein J7K23_09160 [Thermoproteales archaeon]|nr:hypothetical protein [Thermoproteales archaeon]